MSEDIKPLPYNIVGETVDVTITDDGFDPIVWRMEKRDSPKLWDKIMKLGEEERWAEMKEAVLSSSHFWPA